MTNLVKHEPQAIAVSDIEKMGRAIAASGLFGMKRTEEAVALMLVAQAEGRHPALAARDYDIIQGRPALKAKAKLARFQQAGGLVKWKAREDGKASATFSHPNAPQEITITWTLEDAKRAGLNGKDNWKKYPRQMLSARVISEGVDATYPDAGGLMYVPEEVIDFEPEPEAPTPDPTPPKKKSKKKTDPWENMLEDLGITGRKVQDAELFVEKYAYDNSIDIPTARLRAAAHPDGFKAQFEAWINRPKEEPKTEETTTDKYPDFPEGETNEG